MFGSSSSFNSSPLDSDSTVKKTDGSEGDLVHKPLVGRSFKIWIFFSNILGMTPIQGIKGADDNYEIRVVSLKCLLATLVMIWTVFSWIVYFCEFALKTPIVSISTISHEKIEMEIRQNGNFSAVEKSTVLFSIKSAYFIVPPGHIFSILISWKKSQQLSHFLNAWIHFENNFPYSHPPNYYREKYEKDRKLLTIERILLVYMAIPTFFMVFWCIGVFSDELSTVLSCLITITWLFGLVILDLLNDARNVLMYKMCQDAFKKVKWEILPYSTQSHSQSSSSILHHQTNCKSPTSQLVNDWRKLLIRIRGQCSLVNEIQTPSELYGLFNTLGSATFCTFLALTMPWDNEFFQTMCTMWAITGTFIFARTYFKLNSADWISAEEGKVKMTLIMVNVKSEDHSTALEIKSIYDLLTQEPTRIRFGDLFTFNKGLILSIFSQVVQYTIVIMQYSRASN